MENKNYDDIVVAIDLGSNSFHMIVARLVAGQIIVLERHRDKVQMAKYIEDGHLTKTGIERGLEAIGAMQKIIEKYQIAALRCVATNTFRVVNNTTDFTAPASKILGHVVEVITGEDEAKLIYQGASYGMDADQRALVIDIGGGSTEVIVGQGKEILALESFPMGCVSFKKEFAAHTMAEHLFKAKSGAIALVRAQKDKFLKHSWQMSFGCSGSVRAAFEAKGYSFDKYIERQDLEDLFEQCIDDPGLTSLVELRPDRSDVFPTGLAILLALFEELEIKQMTLSKGALREGVLYDLA